jgi:hypothetical protein
MFSTELADMSSITTGHPGGAVGGREEWLSDCLRQTVGCAMVIEPNSKLLGLDRFNSGVRRVDGGLCWTATGSIRQSAFQTESISKSAAISKSESRPEPFCDTSRLIEVTRQEAGAGQLERKQQQGQAGKRQEREADNDQE